MNNKIAHIADLHIRFGSRHQEYKTVFNRLIKDLKNEQPRRIVVAGDIFHLKINMSPTSIDIAGNLLRALSKIAPVDLIIGNHDFNQQDLTQGDAISPLIDLLENGFIVTKENPELIIPKDGNGVYFFKDSGLYEIEEDIIYGVYSLLDNEILTLTEKEKNKKYIALYHGPVYGCVNDNGYQLKGDELMKITAFNNFDIVILGDIHEHQSFERKNGDTAAYSGSLIQQNFGESIEKGYLIWDLNSNEFERKHIPNDYGYCKLNITKGEIVEERLQDLKFSLDKKKTRVYIEIEDDAENENVEKKSQVRKWIKDIHGCENVTVEFKPIIKDKVLESDEDDFSYENSESFEKLLIDYLNQNSYENIQDVIELSKEIDSKINLESNDKKGIEWDLNKMETFNIFSHPAQTNEFDFDKLNGITGIFGKNYSGKSNLIKALVWGLYEKILGGGDNHKVVNLYTGVNKSWVRIYITIAGIKYRIERGITVSSKRDGTTKAAYSVKYEYLSHDEDGEEIWINEDSDRAAKEKKEFKKLIIDSIGTFDDFTKISLQTQGGKDDYLSLQQQPKNDLIRKFFGLEVFDIKYEFANKIFNQIKSVQKQLGDPSEIEKQIEELKDKNSNDKIHLDSLQKDKDENDEQIEIHNSEILELTKKILQLEETTEKNITEVEQKIEKNNSEINKFSENINSLSDWTSKNFLKETPQEIAGLKSNDLENKIESIKTRFQKNKNLYLEFEKWIKENPKLTVEESKPYEDELDSKRKDKLNLDNDLKVSRGEKCPTCKQTTKQANPEVEQECIVKISSITSEINGLQEKINSIKSASTHNINFDGQKNKLDSLKISLQSDKNEMDSLKVNLEKLKQAETDILHNEEVKNKNRDLEDQKNKLKSFEDKNKDLKEQISKIKSNETKISSNSKIDNKIEALKQSIKEYKIVIHQLDNKIKDFSGTIKVNQNNIENLIDKLNQIKESVRIYAKYSVYLQAVSRDGIPAQIIKKKLPIVNYRINSILSNIVNFRIDMFIKNNGDVQEIFYFSPDKIDSLPLSMGSGSQKFVGSIAITDALHSVSCLMKPSLRIIDEGFGTLDEDKTADIGKVFSYLSNRYKNILIITHRTEIKDFVNNIIQVTKSNSGLIKEQVEANPDAGISQFSITS
jgi:DNA repair exonuclease SbcCD ATPase subunit